MNTQTTGAPASENITAVQNQKLFKDRFWKERCKTLAAPEVAMTSVATNKNK